MVDVEQMKKKTFRKVSKLYGQDLLLLSAVKRLLDKHDRIVDIIADCKISRGAWYHFMNGEARDGVRLAIIFTAARKAIERDFFGRSGL